MLGGAHFIRRQPPRDGEDHFVNGVIAGDLVGKHAGPDPDAVNQLAYDPRSRRCLGCWQEMLQLMFKIAPDTLITDGLDALAMIAVWHLGDKRHPGLTNTRVEDRFEEVGDDDRPDRSYGVPA